MSSKKTYQVLAEAFMQENISTCFGLLGDANMKWATHLADLGCDFVYVRHEHCAVASAMAYARKTGDVGVATVTCGPGLTQILTALPAAVRAHLPVVIFTGESPLRLNWYNQELEQAPFIKACGAEYVELHHPDSMLQKIRDAFLLARTEKCPVVIGAPFDLQGKDWPLDESLPAPSHQVIPRTSAVPPNQDDLNKAAELIDQADKVIIMAGLGAVEADAADACKKLAEKIGGLLSTTLPARGLFYDEDFNLNVAGGFSSDVTKECFHQADLVISVGTSIASHNAAGGKLHQAAKVLQIDLKPSPVSQGRDSASHHLLADARLGVEALIEKVKEKPDTSWRTPGLAERIKNTPPDSTPFDIEPGFLDPRDVVSELDKHLPKHWQMVNSSGHCSYFFAHMNGRPADRFLTIREFGAIGNGISFAMGVATARPETPTVLFDGDGSLLMHIQEFETIKRHGMKILFCILNDGAYGSEIHKLRATGLSDRGAVFGYPDLAGMAKGFGLTGHRVTDLNQLPQIIAAFEQGDTSCLLDFHISDQVTSPVIRAAHPNLEPNQK